MATTTSKQVLNHYSSLAREDPSLNASHAQKVAQSFGYTPEDLSAIPSDSNLGVSCGNPLSIASLKAGETVIDLGCGAGFDIFQAARKVGQNGMAIGVDMSEDMLGRAHSNTKKGGFINVRFILSPITKIDLEDRSVDCVISNCVINLLPQEEKLVCFKEIFRLLKPGGRMAVSDILAKKEFLEELRADIGLFVGCISGASLVGEYEHWLKEAGFENVLIVDKGSDLNIYKERGGEQDSTCCAIASDKISVATSSCCSTSKNSDSTERKETSDRVSNIDFNEWASSYNIYAVKPGKS